MLRTFFVDETGFVVSTELVLIFTLMFCGVAVGTALLRDSITQELGDISKAVGALNQSYQYNTISAPIVNGTVAAHASCSGSGFNDLSDICDLQPITFTTIAPRPDPQGGNGINGGNGNNGG